MTLVLHHAPDFASTIVRLALTELDLPFRVELVDGGAQASPAFRRISPLGLIPVLKTPDGPIFETGAILLWLADRTGRLAPRPGDPDRGAFLAWLFFTSNALHQSALAMFYPHRPAGEAHVNAVQAAAAAQLTTRLQLIEAMLAEKAPRWLSPAEPGVLGYYIGILVRWLILLPPEPYRLDLSAYPVLRATLAAHEARPAARLVAEADGLGPTPFTDPRA